MRFKNTSCDELGITVTKLEREIRIAKAKHSFLELLDCYILSARAKDQERTEMLFRKWNSTEMKTLDFIDEIMMLSCSITHENELKERYIRMLESIASEWYF